MPQSLSTVGARAAALDPGQLLNLYRVMRTIRAFEDRLHEEFATGDIPGAVHLYAGQEAAAAGVCAHLDEERDVIVSSHRGHGHCIAKGLDVTEMMAEIFGKRTGSCAGKGGSMHIADFSKGMLGANGIVGGGPPLICGAALAAKIRNDGGVGVTFFGDGAVNQGTTLESLNLASVWKLPVLFVAENNGYGEGAASDWAVAGGSIAGRAGGFGMPGITVDGTDVLAVYDAAGEAVELARAGGGPTLLEVKSTRFYGHFEGDPQTYRGKDEVRDARENLDSVRRFRQWMAVSGQFTDSELDAVDDTISLLIDNAVAAARAADSPESSALLTDVYSRY